MYPFSQGLAGWHFQPFLTPDARYPLVVYLPAIGPEKGRDTAVAIPPILTGQRHDVRGQNRFIIGHSGGVSLSTAHLTQHTTRPTLRDGQCLTHVNNRLPTPHRA